MLPREALLKQRAASGKTPSVIAVPSPAGRFAAVSPASGRVSRPQQARRSTPSTATAMIARAQLDEDGLEALALAAALRAGARRAVGNNFAVVAACACCGGQAAPRLALRVVRVPVHTDEPVLAGDGAD